MNSLSKVLTDEDENTSLRPRTIHFSSNTQRSNSTTMEERSSTNINILRSQPHYSSVDDSQSVSVASFAGADGGRLSVDSNLVDMEALLTMALETTTQKVDRENKKRQNTMLAIVGFIFIISLCILSTVTFSEYPEDHELHSQIDTLERDVDQLHGELNTFENDENIDLLKRDIDDKRLFIQELENDENIDPKEKQKLVTELQGQIDDLKVEVHKMEKTKYQGGQDEIKAAEGASGNNGS